MSNQRPNTFYRYDAKAYVSISDYDYDINNLNRNIRLILTEYNLHKETPKGYWIGHGYLTEGLRSKSIWVSKIAKKRFAYPSKEEALNNFIKRSLRRKDILERQLSDCIYGLNLANEVFENTK